MLFSWLEYPDRAARDAAVTKLMSDPRMGEMGAHVPFDAKRMIWGGFKAINEAGKSGRPGSVDGTVIPVPADKEAAYREMAERCSAVFMEYGATRVVDAWADDVPDGKVTDFKGAVNKQPFDGKRLIYGGFRPILDA